MNVTRETVRAERQWVLERDGDIVSLINEVRDQLGPQFGVTVDHVTTEQYRDAVTEVFADGDLAVNVAALVALLRDLDVTEDYPGFVVDELLGRELAGMIAGQQPLRLLGEATFHYTDVHTDADSAGTDDLDAALAAGFQTRLPGWDWTETESLFAVE